MLWVAADCVAVGLMVPPMSLFWRTVMLFGSGGKLYMCPVYTWWNSLETALVTGPLLFVTPGCRLVELSDCVSLTIFSRHCVAEIATGSSRSRGILLRCMSPLTPTGFTS